MPKPRDENSPPDDNGERLPPAAEDPQDPAARDAAAPHSSMLRPVHREVGKAPGIEPHELSQLPSTVADVKVTCVDYCPDQVRIQKIDDIPAFLAAHRPEWSAVRWINIDGLTNMQVIRAFAEKYELHPLAVEDVMHRGQRPKAEDYPGSAEHPGRLFVVTQLVQLNDDRLHTDQVSFFLGRKTLVTFQERPGEIFAPILSRIRNRESRLRQSDVSFLLYCLLDAIVDHFFPILEEISDRLETIEDTVLSGGRQPVLPKIHQFRRDLAVLRRVSWPMRDLINDLNRERHECLSETTHTYLRDVYDHVVQVLDLVETYREFADSLTETYMSATSNRMNDIVKTLTIISTIFVPLTFFAGVYGMNMQIPENSWAWSYPVFWLVSVGAAVAMLYGFRRRGWL